MSIIQPQPSLPGTQPQPLNPQVERLAQQPQVQNNQITKGSIIIFPYLYYKNDPVPCVIVSSVGPTLIKGVNLHFLTFFYVQKLLPLAGNPTFGYYNNIKPDRYIVSAFRSYLVRGIVFGKARMVDAKFLSQVMAMVTSFDPVQIRAIRQQIEQQLYAGYPQPAATPQQSFNNGP